MGRRDSGMDSSSSRCKKKGAEIDSRIALNRGLAAEGLVLSPDELAHWTPSKLPRSKRLELKISFDFVDTPFKDALAVVEQRTGLKFELGPKFSSSSVPNINL